METSDLTAAGGFLLGLFFGSVWSLTILRFALRALEGRKAKHLKGVPDDTAG